MRQSVAIGVLIFCAIGMSADRPAKPGKPSLEGLVVTIASSRDSEQKAIFYCPDPAKPGAQGGQGGQAAPVPLLVALHTWSGNFEQSISYLPEARKRGWVLVGPDFRGPNSRPEACASELAIQDVLDAVEYAKKNAKVDESRIYLVGGSGGGHMALMMAGKAPGVWAGVSAWVPISDLAAWHEQTKSAKRNYWQMLEKSCGGPPGPDTMKEYRARSPLTWLAAAKAVPLDINTGIHDGHTGSVPVSHAMEAFNVIARAGGMEDRQIPAAQIAAICQTQQVPAELAGQRQEDPERKKAVLFRRVAGCVRITLFEGGHDQETAAALNWLARQKKGQPADFTLHQSAPDGGGASSVLK